MSETQMKRERERERAEWQKYWEPDTEMMVEWRRETEVLTKRGSREIKDRTTQLAIWKKTAPATIQSSSERLLKIISNRTETNHRIRVARKKVPALFFSFWLWLVLLAIVSIVIRCGWRRQKDRESIDFWRCVRGTYNHGAEVRYFCSLEIGRGGYNRNWRLLLWSAISFDHRCPRGRETRSLNETPYGLGPTKITVPLFVHLWGDLVKLVAELDRNAWQQPP